MQKSCQINNEKDIFIHLAFNVNYFLYRRGRCKFFYTVIFANESQNLINIKGFNNSDELIVDHNIMPSQMNVECTYPLESFLAYGCGADSLIFRFDNGKGYICTSFFNADKPCFENRSPYNTPSYKDLGGNKFRFTITEEDFQNAKELPD